MYQLGIGVPQDNTEALGWFQKSALQGDANAQYSAGPMFLNGKGTSKDVTKALEWWSKAATQGRMEAKHKLNEHKTTCIIL
ncbi:hypothetical protein BGZ80_003042 [Entomortierella chlamydospora]|uniref:Sel1 repeat family protein n=1 Tax=Entomortierella chlamydospora TaxID=101097 RepID=A0A9P6SWQ7_9FUNG|nr:hypothetical protein BGZ80_003042 [Entomortierella chlamydospora]